MAMPNHRPDADLVRSLEDRAREGDRDAIDEVVLRSRDGLVRFCYRYLGNVAEAEDATQDTFTALIRSAEWPRGSLRAWLYRVARCRCLDRLKRRGLGPERITSVVGESALGSPRTGPRTALGRLEEQERLQARLATLSPAKAEVLVLRFFEGLARREIAQVLELPESVVKSRLFEGVQELRRDITEGAG